jgi:lipopolysaccharide/colanic/teichoic acid biosynthesis glycosyltransferase
MKRFFDIAFSMGAIVLLLPVFVVVSFGVLLDGRGGILFRQQRVGLNGRLFPILKFRTMKPDDGRQLQITVGSRDPRITHVGYWLRRYKLDELPQLFNVLVGQMSLVGPRPEVPKYVALYSDEQRRVLTVRPGITDLASLKYFEESDLIAQSSDPEKTYVEIIMPEKLRLNMEYINRPSLRNDVRIIFHTVLRILGITR